MNIFKRIKAEIVYSLAVRRADDAHHETGERYYVVPSLDNKLVIVDRKNFRALKRKHYVDNDATIAQIQKECFYCTPYSNGSGAMPTEIFLLKRAAFLDWYAKC